MKSTLTRHLHFGLAIIISVMVMLYIALQRNTFLLFPTDNKSIAIGTAHEELDSNWSKSTVEIKADGIHFRYRLAGGQEEPFATVYLHKITDKDLYFDFSSFNHIYISFKADKAQRVPFTFTIDVPGFTSNNKPLSNVPLTVLLDCKSGENEYNLSLDNFEIPSWWLRHHQLDKDFSEKLQLNRVSYIILNSCQTIKKNISDELIIHSIRLEQKFFLWWLLIGMTWFFALLAEFILRFKKKKKLEIIFTPTTSINDSFAEEDKIIAFIAGAYSNPGLLIGDVQKGIGISTRKISKLLQEKFSLSFNDYLNQIRIAEVKRLLKETSLPISEIAYNAGFSNVSHFNRVFKQMTGISPSQYRDEGNIKQEP